MANLVDLFFKMPLGTLASLIVFGCLELVDFCQNKNPQTMPFFPTDFFSSFLIFL